MPTGVLMHSIGINNPVDIHYYILINESITEDNKNSLQRIAKQYGNEIEFYLIDEGFTKALPFGRENMPDYISIATYYRLFITEILPKDVHKIIYLDGDMIVRMSLEPLWTINLTEYAVACVHDMSEKLFISSGKHNYPSLIFGYFNAGMLVINIDYWRDYNCLNRFVDYIQHHHDDIVFHDQDVLNNVLYKEKKWVSTSYNFQIGFLREGDNIDYIDSIYDEVGDNMQNPTIIHYCTKDKPWQLYSYNPYVRVWRHYWSKSEWKKNKLEGENPDCFKHYISAFLLKKGWLIRKSGRLKRLLNR